MIYSFISYAQGRVYSLHSPCRVKKHDPQQNSFTGKEWDALWDTGATCSVITPKIVKELGIAPVSYAIVSGVNGQGHAAQYYVDLGLPSGVTMSRVLAIEGNPLGCDLLIGMDVIGMGDFIASCCNGTTHFGLKLPSEISREEMADLLKGAPAGPAVKTGKQVGRNSKCPCGSGKKYKQCCGKE